LWCCFHFCVRELLDERWFDFLVGTGYYVNFDARFCVDHLVVLVDVEIIGLILVVSGIGLGVLRGLNSTVHSCKLVIDVCFEVVSSMEVFDIANELAFLICEDELL
jgi:hypothetical protein